MTLLLDTHVLIWSATSPGRIRPAVLDAMRETEQVMISAVSAYEMTFKLTLGKLAVARRLLADLPSYLERMGYGVLPITLAHAEAAGRLSLEHRDPFDRLLASQALVENLTLVSGDQAFDLFSVKRLW